MLDDTLLGFLLGKSGDEHFFMMDTVIVFVKDPITMEDFTIEAFMGETSFDIKQKIYRMKGYPIEQQRLVFAGRQTADLGTISSHNIQTGNKIHVNMWMHGGAKKGVKKVTKQEKLHLLKAKVHYTTSQLNMADPQVPALCHAIAQPNYISSVIANMNMQQITDLDNAAQDCSRTAQLTNAIAPELVPQYKQLKAQKAAIENSLKAIEEAVDLGMTEDYWRGTTGVNADAFYGAIENRLGHLTEQDRINAAIARGVASAAQAADPADVDM